MAKHEDSLFKDLFQNYERWVRPVEHLHDKIKIKFGLAISQLVDVVGVPSIFPSGVVSLPCAEALGSLVRETSSFSSGLSSGNTVI